MDGKDKPKGDIRSFFGKPPPPKNPPADPLPDQPPKHTPSKRAASPPKPSPAKKTRTPPSAKKPPPATTTTVPMTDSDELVVVLDDDQEEEEKKVVEEKKPSKTPVKVKAPPPAPAAPPPARPAPPSSSRKRPAPGPQDVEEAKRLVQAAIASLSAHPNYTILSSEDFPATAPPHRNTKTIPRGHPDCLSGLTFVLTGTFDSLTREEMTDLIKRHNGKITAAVSSKTTFLVVGLDSSKSKIEVAKEKKVPLIDEDGVIALVHATEHLALDEEEEKRHVEETQRMMKEVRATMTTGAAPPPATTTTTTTTRPAPMSHQPAPLPRPPPNVSGLWVDKHKPVSMKDLVGNAQVVQTLRTWLSDWRKVHLSGLPATEVKSHGKTKDLSKKAVMLSGPPGIGKTTSAMLVARELGYEPVEVNASDARGKADADPKKGLQCKTSNMIKELSVNTSVGMFGKPVPRKVIIMDECDGMSAGDRGGIADLIQTIQKSKIPIICICNDKYSQKLKSLRNHCVELDFHKPDKRAVAKRLQDILRGEGLSLNDAALEAVIEGAQGDIRLILGQLQMMRLRGNRVTYDQVKTGQKSSSKDAEMSPFNAAALLLNIEGAQIPLRDRAELVFQDLDLVPLLVQENYLNHRPSVAASEVQRLRVMARAAEAISAGDVVTNRVRRYQDWSLAPFAAFVGSVYPGTYMRGPREVFGLFPGETNFPRFTAWLGNNSSYGKQRRLTSELHTRLLASEHFVADRNALRLDYMPTLKRALLLPLQQRQAEAVDEVLDVMHEYCLVRDDLEFLSDITLFKSKQSWNEDMWKAVDSKVKATMTRTYNKDPSKAKTNTMVEEFKRVKGGKGKKKTGGGGGGGGGSDMETLGGELDDAAAVEAGSEEEEEVEETPEERAARLKRDGIQLALKDDKKKGKSAGETKSTGAKKSTAAAAKKK